jgi:ketosteroid isomerase-like protein
MPNDTPQQAILALERSALDRWAQGNAFGYVEIDADDVTYFDDIGAHTRVEGIAGMRAYATSLEGKIPPHRYEVVDPKVQLYGDVGILTLRYHAFAVDGKPLARWKATSVNRHLAGGWRIAHAHWSTVKDA